MGQGKKRKIETLDEVLARPWCYYCDRDFDDVKILVDHQKAKHFHCIVSSCHRRLNTAGGLKVHMQQVHKEDLNEVPNALDGRQGVTPEIFGMEGVPQDLKDRRKGYIISLRERAEAEWRAKTGNPLSGSKEAEQGPPKKVHTESIEDVKARVAAIKAKRAAEKAAQAAGQTLPDQGTSNANGPVAPGYAMPGTNPTPPGMPGYGPPPGVTAAPPFADPRMMTGPYAQQGGFVSPPGFGGHAPPYQAPYHYPNNFGARPPGMTPFASSPPATEPVVLESSRYFGAPAPSPKDAVHSKMYEMFMQGPPPKDKPSINEAKVSSGEGNAKVKRSKEKKSGTADETTKLLLSDNTQSWEEKRAKLPRYKPKPKPDMVPTNMQDQGIAGPVDDQLRG